MSIETAHQVSDPRPSDDRNGCFLDKMWCCKVCDGEIPDGHTENCDIWKLEKKHREFIAKEYNAVLTERDKLRAALEKAADTFADLNNGLRLLNRPLLAEACEIAEKASREALS